MSKIFTTVFTLIGIIGELLLVPWIVLIYANAFSAGDIGGGLVCSCVILIILASCGLGVCLTHRLFRE